jgi:putative peptide zinc metalloprotease protein
VVWLPEKSLVRASENGFFQEWLVQPGHQVRAGTPLFLMSDAELEAELKQVQARCDEAEARFRSEQFSDPAKARLSLRQLEQEQATLARVKERHDRLLVHAEADGILVVAKAADLPGQFIKQGALVAHVLDKQELIARVVITQDDIDLVRQRLDHLELRYADQIESTYPSHIVRQATGAVTELPSPALGLGGGGEIPTQPNDKEGLQTLQRVFLMDLALPGSMAPAAFGERVYVRFSLDWEPMGWQILRRLRQLFLREFSV